MAILMPLWKILSFFEIILSKTIDNVNILANTSLNLFLNLLEVSVYVSFPIPSNWLFFLIIVDDIAMSTHEIGRCH